MSAPTDGPYAGMLLMQHPSAPSYNGGNIIQNITRGGSVIELKGALYFPNQGVTFTGGSEDGPGGCLQIVAKTVTFTGNTYINNDPDECAAAGINVIDQRRVRVIE